MPKSNMETITCVIEPAYSSKRKLTLIIGDQNGTVSKEVYHILSSEFYQVKSEELLQIDLSVLGSGQYMFLDEKIMNFLS